MFTFAMDCLFLGIVIVLLLESFGYYRNDMMPYKHMTILSVKLGLVLFALSNWIFGLGIMWSMWE